LKWKRPENPVSYKRSGILFLDFGLRWIGDKNMPAHRVGRLWKFRKEEIDEWVKSGSAGETVDH
jgi:excisionase family DNA binding protein